MELKKKMILLDYTIQNLPEEIFEQKNLIEDINKVLNENNLNKSVKIIFKFKPIVEGLCNLVGPECESFTNLKENFEILIHFIEKDRKIRIPFFGGYSTGKSSILNSLIGKDILPVGSNITTNRVIVVRNNNEGKYILYSTNFVQKGDYYIFKEKEIIKDCGEENWKEIKDFLEEQTKINLNDFHELFYILSVPLLFLGDINIKDDIKNKVELIDFPGIDVGEDIFEVELFNHLIKLSDSFIFINAYNLINNTDNIEMIQKIISKIEMRKINFEYNSCLFILNKCEEKIDINNSKEQIEKILFGGNKKESSLDYFKIFQKNKHNINVTKFSNLFFSQFLDIDNGIKDFRNFIEKRIEEVKEEEEEGCSTSNNLIEGLYISIKEYLKDNYSFENIENNDIDIAEFEKYKDILYDILSLNNINIKSIENNKNFIENILSNYKYMLKNRKKNKCFLSSNGYELLESLETIIINSSNMIENQFKQKSIEELKDLKETFQIIQINISKNKTINIIDKKRKMKKCLEDIDKALETTKLIIDKKIQKFFNLFDKNINELKNEINKKDANLNKIKSDLQKISDTYDREFRNLKKEIDQKIKDFIEILKEIKQDVKTEEELEFKEEVDSHIQIGLFTLGGSIIAVPAAVIGLFTGSYLLLDGILMKIYNYFIGKEKILTKINQLDREINKQREATISNIDDNLSEITKKFKNEIRLIYEASIISNDIEKDTFLKLYDEFKKILDEN